jgi:hypothetical protein
MLHATRRAPSNRNAVLRRGLRGTTSHIFYPLQGVGRLGDDGDDLPISSGYDDGNDSYAIAQSAGVLPVVAAGDFGTASTFDPWAPPGSATNPSNTQLSSLVTSNPAYTGGSSGPSTNSLIASIFGSVAAVAAPAVKALTQQSPYYITGPNGQAVLYNPNTGTTAGTLGASLSTISPMVWLLGIGAVALFAFSGKK